MVTVDIPQLYGKDAKKVWLHLDSAASNNTKSTQDWLDAHDVNYSTEEKWLADSLNCPPWISLRMSINLNRGKGTIKH
jgi:hypothetical protein